MNYLHDDNDKQENGTADTLLSKRNEAQAQRNSIARRFEDYLPATLDWANISDDKDAQGIYLQMQDLYEAIGAALEKTGEDMPDNLEARSNGERLEGERAEADIAKDLRESFPARVIAANY